MTTEGLRPLVRRELSDQPMWVGRDAHEHVLQVLERWDARERTALHERVEQSGAAGGLGAGLVAFTGARLRPGAEMVMEALSLDDRIRGADLVITGEGRLDSQTARFGKGPAAVARHARNAAIPVVGLGGSIADEVELRPLFDGLEATVVEACSLEDAIAQARPLLVRATTRAMRLLQTGRRLATRVEPRS